MASGKNTTPDLQEMPARVIMKELQRCHRTAGGSKRTAQLILEFRWSSFWVRPDKGLKDAAQFLKQKAKLTRRAACRAARWRSIASLSLTCGRMSQDASSRTCYGTFQVSLPKFPRKTNEVQDFSKLFWENLLRLWDVRVETDKAIEGETRNRWTQSGNTVVIQCLLHHHVMLLRHVNIFNCVTGVLAPDSDPK